MNHEPESTTTISDEALRRLEVEAAYGRGETIECRYRDRNTYSDPWEHTSRPCWDWGSVDYRVKPKTAKPAMTAERAARRELLDRIEALIAELKAQDA